MPRPPKLNKEIPLLTDVISKGNRAKQAGTNNGNNPASHDPVTDEIIDRDELEKAIKSILDKKLAVYKKLLSAELTRDIMKKLENSISNKPDNDAP